MTIKESAWSKFQNNYTFSGSQLLRATTCLSQKEKEQGEKNVIFIPDTKEKM